jgi:hypothetical protein
VWGSWKKIERLLPLQLIVVLKAFEIPSTSAYIAGDIDQSLGLHLEELLTDLIGNSSPWRIE